MRGRPKGGTNKTWSSQEKYKIIKPVLKGEISKTRYESYVMIYDKIKGIKDWEKK